MPKAYVKPTKKLVIHDVDETTCFRLARKIEDRLGEDVGVMYDDSRGACEIVADNLEEISLDELRRLIRSLRSEAQL